MLLDRRRHELENKILQKLGEKLMSEALLLGYDSGLIFDYNNPYKKGTLLWQQYMFGYIIGSTELDWKEA